MLLSFLVSVALPGRKQVESPGHGGQGTSSPVMSAGSLKSPRWKHSYHGDHQTLQISASSPCPKLMVEHFLARHGLFLCLFIVSPTVLSA